MKNIKKCMAIFLALALVITGINQGSSFVKADSTPQIYGEDASANPGDEISIPVMIKNNPGFTGLGFLLDYDRNVLTLQKVKKGSVLEDTDDAQLVYTDEDMSAKNDSNVVASNILFSSPADNNIEGDGQVFTLVFKVSESASGGKQTIKMSGAEKSNFQYGYTAIDFTFSDINVNITGSTTVTTAPVTTKTPATTQDSSTSKTVYTWCGEITGWGGSDSYPSSANHAQGSGDDNFYYTDLTDINFSKGYGCGLELMNPYNNDFTGADNEMAQFIKTMKTPCIKVTLKNGGAASSWNWSEELSFPSGVAKTLPSGYLDNQYFVLFGNDDTITKVEIYDADGANVQQATLVSGDTTGDTETKVTAAPSTNTETTAPATENPTGVPTEVPGVTADSTNTPASVASTPAVTKTPSSIDDNDDYVKVKKPGRVKIKKLKKSGKGCAKVSWSKVKCSDGYEIQYSTRRSFAKKQTGLSYSRSYNIYGKSKKKYYVRVRAVNYGQVSSYRYGYKKGAWSKVKAIRLK